ncbi:hypothetical protein ACFVFQ_28745 [Streptomyces sp. NPDC057743]|uniref:hypothetical protein n=1 Tax=Streptomyces sp. NPDC057743 TaxID=3346236 RepID=UPI0036C8D293
MSVAPNPQVPGPAAFTAGQSDGAGSTTIKNVTGVVSLGNDNVIVYIDKRSSAEGALTELAKKLVDAVRAQRSSVDRQLADEADLLAHDVRGRLQYEAEQLGLEDRELPVRWKPVREKTPYPEDLRNARAEETPTRSHPTAGQEAALTATLEQAQSHWLMVLGRAGSGKSALALRFALARLKARAHGAPVPVIFSIGSWNPTIPLRDWLIARLEREHTYLTTASPSGETWAAALVGADYVLPILDGFDEIATGLRKLALRELNKCGLPMLVTSRHAEFEAARKETNVEPSAAAIELIDLKLDDAINYLQAATGTPLPASEDATPRTGWAYVLGELHYRSHEPDVANLAAVLTTSLMVTLARFVYESKLDPSDLLKPEKFGTREALENHLLDAFITTAYERVLRDKPVDTDNPEGLEERSRRVERARHWLGYLAAHLTELKTPDIEWWRLGTTVRLRWLMLRVGVTVWIASGLVTGLSNGSVGGLVLGPSYGLRTAAITGPLDGLGIGLAFGLMHGFVTKMKVGGPKFEPSLMEIRLRGWTKNGTVERLRESFRPRVKGGLAGGLLFGLLWALGSATFSALVGYPGDLIALAAGETLAAGIGLGLAMGFIAALGAGFETVIPREQRAHPSVLLNTNRATVLKQTLTIGFVVGSGYGIFFGLVTTALGGLGAGLAAGCVIALGIGTMTAWGRWVVLARIWLPLSGWLPRDLDAFLRDACKREVLRQVGTVYQFRHAKLRDHLCATTNTPPERILYRTSSLDRLFNVVDADGDGHVGGADYRRIVERYRTAYELAADAPEVEALTSFYKEYWAGLQRHAKTDDRLSRKQHRAAAVATTTDPALQEPVAAFGAAVFQVIDADHDGYVGEQELTRYLAMWDLARDASRVLDQLDTDGDGRLSKDDLTRAIHAYFYSPDRDGTGGVFFGVG